MCVANVYPINIPVENSVFPLLLFKYKRKLPKHYVKAVKTRVYQNGFWLISRNIKYNNVLEPCNLCKVHTCFSILLREQISKVFFYQF